MKYVFEKKVETLLKNLDVFKTWNSKQLFRKFTGKFVRLVAIFQDHEE